MVNMTNIRIVLHQVNYLDVLTGRIEYNKTIIMEKELISWIGDADSFEKSQEDELIAVPENCIVLPGLMDCHVHLGSQSVVNFEQERMRTKTHKYSYYGLKNAWLHLTAGFTTLRDCGGETYGSSLRNLFETGYLPGPRLLVAQHPISQYGNQEFVGPDDLYISNRYPDTISGRDGVIHAVRDRIKSGSDFIKTMTSGGVMHGQGSKLDRHFFNDQDLESMVGEAHRMGIHVAAHAHGDAGIYSATKAGIDTIEHGSFISEETMKLMVQKKNYLVPTQTSAFIDKPDLMANLPPEIIAKTTEVDTAMFKNHKIAFEKGVKIALGTDAGVPGNPHGTSAKEITSMVEKVHMTPVQAIQCATIESAKAIKIDDITGSLVKGKQADMIVVQGNVLENIKILENKVNIKYVVKDGQILASNGHMEQFL